MDCKKIFRPTELESLPKIVLKSDTLMLLYHIFVFVLNGLPDKCIRELNVNMLFFSFRSSQFMMMRQSDLQEEWGR